MQSPFKGGTRLVLSSPVSVRAGARVGLYLQCTSGDRVCLTARGKQGDVDASDGALAVLYGRYTYSKEPFGELGDSKHGCFVPAGAIEYELAIAEADPPAPEPSPEQSPLERVCALGFAPSEATAALAACGGDALRAVERLVRSQSEEQIAAVKQASALAVAQAEAATKATVEQVKMQAATTQARAEAEVMLAKAEAAEAKAEAAAAKVASPASAGPTIDEWLAGLHLEVYTAAVKETGYTVLLFLKDAQEQDLDEMARDIGMKRPHLRTLKRACRQLVAEADSGGVASSAASEPELEPEESHGAFIEPLEPAHEFDLVFSNKTAFDSLCLEVRAKLVPEGVRVWQQRTNIPKDSDNCKSPRSSVRMQACIFLALMSSCMRAHVRRVQRMVPVGDQGAQDRLLHLGRLPEVAVLHGVSAIPCLCHRDMSGSLTLCIFIACRKNSGSH
eukprot:COSAG02_NODE_2125_length_9747_cov_13.746683_10_plen_447_part_00